MMQLKQLLLRALHGKKQRFVHSSVKLLDKKKIKLCTLHCWITITTVKILPTLILTFDAINDAAASRGVHERIVRAVRHVHPLSEPAAPGVPVTLPQYPRSPALVRPVEQHQVASFCAFRACCAFCAHRNVLAHFVNLKVLQSVIVFESVQRVDGQIEKVLYEIVLLCVGV